MSELRLTYGQATLIHKVVSPFVAKDRYRLVLTQMRWFATDGTLTVEATDSYKLCRFLFPGVRMDSTFDQFVDSAWFGDVLRAIRHRSLPVDLIWTAGMMKVVNNDRTFTQDQPDMTAVNMDRMLADNVPTGEVDMTTPTPALAVHQLRAITHLTDHANVTIARVDNLKPVVFDVQATNDEYRGTVLIMPVRRAGI